MSSSPLRRGDGQDEKTVAVNRKAFHDYDILQTLEAGISLTGTEIKSVRQGHASIREGYVRPQDDELWLVGAHIARYPPADKQNHEPTRSRRLLLHRKEIRELARALDAGGMTIVPLRLYLKRGRAKLEIGLARGKRSYDKRAAVAKRDAERQIQRAMRHRV
ncbi:MAG TPA: SsrA-binding protein SmpB [Dehalococcoidia bacterium]|nr:SsrA-binding protein SmpB [Dehalococcoidia bacterium]